ncbi:MAG: tetratricopeptide repeat protein [Anaerolineae bacterium]
MSKSISGWLDRALWTVGVLLLITVVGFGLFYFRDRYVHANEPLVERQVRHLEAMVRQNPTDPDVRVAVAQWYLAKGLVGQAIQQGQEALKLDADHQDALILLGRAYLAKGDDEQAIADFARVVELNRDSEFAKIDPRMNLVYYNLGELYRQQGEYDSAMEALKAALEVDRTDADARYALALAYQEQGDHQAAVREFNEALRYVPDFAEVYQGLLMSYEALGMITEMAYADAMVSYSQADYQPAAQGLEALIQAAPDFDPAYLGLGMTYEKLGQKEKAIAALQRYLEAHPHSLAARHALGRLGVRIEEQ